MKPDTLIKVIQYDLKDKEYIVHEIDELSKQEKDSLHKLLNSLIEQCHKALSKAERSLNSYKKQQDKQELFRRVISSIEDNIANYDYYLRRTNM